jgi:peptidoglycan/xylan/chitin deacetylase (PgdA/CDA1 family)
MLKLKFHFAHNSLPFKLLLDFLLGLLFSLFIFKTFTVEVPIFGFHGIFDQNTPPASIKNFDYPKEKLKLFLTSLIEKKYWFLSTEELYDYFIDPHPKAIPPEHSKDRPILLSFDDGYKSTHNNLMEILPELENTFGKKIKVTLFINPGFMGKEGINSGHASCADLREGFKKGYYDLQSHGQNHENLTKISLTNAESELSRAQKNLKECLIDLDSKFEVANHFAYPFGATNKAVEKLTSKYYKSSYLYNSKSLTPFWSKDKYLVSRFTVNRETSLHKLIAKAQGSWF